MKNILIILMSIVSFSFLTLPTGISKKERKTATRFLKDSEKNILGLVSKLSEAQLKFKPSPEQWSVEECMMHIAATDKMLGAMLMDSVKAAPNPEKRADIKMTDEQVMTMIEQRTTKVKTFAPLEPPNTGFKSAAEAMTAYKDTRAKLINYVNSTNDDLRNHVLTLRLGSLDAYQMALFIGGHGNRHLNQMKEVMAHADFPKK